MNALAPHVRVDGLSHLLGSSACARTNGRLLAVVDGVKLVKHLLAAPTNIVLAE
jgi:hypothetical protein